MKNGYKLIIKDKSLWIVAELWEQDKKEAVYVGDERNKRSLVIQLKLVKGVANKLWAVKQLWMCMIL